MGTCDDSPRLQAEGECPDTGVSSHTTRSVHAQKPAMRHPQLMYRMARHWNTGAFFPLARSPRTHRSQIVSIWVFKRPKQRTASSSAPEKRGARCW